jgi:hypothetical protein
VENKTYLGNCAVAGTWLCAVTTITELSTNASMGDLCYVMDTSSIYTFDGVSWQCIGGMDSAEVSSVTWGSKDWAITV